MPTARPRAGKSPWELTRQAELTSPFPQKQRQKDILGRGMALCTGTEGKHSLHPARSLG